MNLHGRAADVLPCADGFESAWRRHASHLLGGPAPVVAASCTSNALHGLLRRGHGTGARASQ
eukprot:3767233-Prymnesium_polylepis.1